MCKHMVFGRIYAYANEEDVKDIIFYVILCTSLHQQMILVWNFIVETRLKNQICFCVRLCSYLNRHAKTPKLKKVHKVHENLRIPAQKNKMKSNAGFKERF